MTFLPYLVPGIAFAVAYLSLFAVPRGPVPALYGTAAILVLIYLAEQMPFASRAGISSMMQLGPEPEEAAQVAGAGWWRRMAGIVLPIQKRSLAIGVLLPFIAGVRSLSLVVILAVPGMDVLTTFAIKLVEFGFTQAANGVVLIISAIAFGGTYAIQKTMKTDLGRGLGG
jgi:iron(III) transport system permease protein